jgi:hypothetical protein
MTNTREPSRWREAARPPATRVHRRSAEQRVEEAVLGAEARHAVHVELDSVLSFAAWRSLVREQGLAQPEAVDLMRAERESPLGWMKLLHDHDRLLGAC